MEQTEKEQIVPLFRPEIQLFRGPYDADGSPTYQLYDPVRGDYFKISWPEAQVIKRLKPGMTFSELHHAVISESTLRLEEADLRAFIAHADGLKLIERPISGSELHRSAQAAQSGLLKTILLNYLFFKIPFWNPDDFLDKTLAYVRPLVSPVALILYTLCIVGGIIPIILHWEEFINTFGYFFSMQGALAYAVAIMTTKAIHELAHGYVAKGYGLRIPTMGVAFLVLFPVLYTDATESWRLQDRRKRMIISGAGIAVELTIAGISTLLWALSSPGIFQSVCFILASANWIGTLAINLNPALRFDGYYLLSDYLKVDNLQPRAFQITRCAAYRTFLGLNIADPEPKLSRSKKRILTVYSIYTLLYRIVLYTTIALFVYHSFTKVVGIFLFSLEILIFFLWPIYSESQQLKKVYRSLSWNPRSVALMSGLALLLCWFSIPLPHRLYFPATTLVSNTHTLYSPREGQLDQLFGDSGKIVKAGAPLAVITSNKLNARLSTLHAERQLQIKKIEIFENDKELRPYLIAHKKQLLQLNEEISTTQKLMDQLTITAETEGYLLDWDRHLRKGQWIKKDQILGKIAPLKDRETIFFVSEHDLDKVDIGDTVYYRPIGTFNDYTGTVVQVGAVRAQWLLYPELASTFGGPLETIESKDRLRLVDSVYPITINLDNGQNLPIGKEGVVIVNHRWSSKLMQLVRTITHTLLRESDI